jgi:DNA mismatch endonuclease (patch repair protein)
MVDRLSIEHRSWLMSRIKGKNTKPEIAVRSMLHRMGYRFRIHARELPGTPDIVLPRHETVVLVHGCFWHGHRCKIGKMPKSRVEYWDPKIEATKARDRRKRRQLRALGWKAIVVWECELKNPERLRKKLAAALAC